MSCPSCGVTEEMIKRIGYMQLHHPSCRVFLFNEKPDMNTEAFVSLNTRLTQLIQRLLQLERKVQEIERWSMR